MNAATEEVAIAQPALAQPTRPFYWLVRREFWENRSLLIVPIVVCGLIVFSVLLSMLSIGHVSVDGVEVAKALRMLNETDSAASRAILSTGFGFLAVFVSIAMIIVGWFYTLDSLHGERRDRSILFWKSLPVSDAQTVLSKVLIASVGICGIAFAFTFATHLLLMILNSLYLLVNGVSPGMLWGRLTLVEQPLLYAYALLAQMLWFAPVYCYLVLVSAWAKRLPFLWAILPPALIAMCEEIAFGSEHFLNLLGHRFSFAVQSHAFAVDTVVLARGPERLRFPTNLLDLADPVAFFSNPYLWIGLVVAAAFAAGAIWLRRYREPN